MSTLVFRTVDHGSAEYVDTMELRDEVLRKPLGLVFSPEQLGAEASDIHLACYRDEMLAGCLVLTPEEEDRTIRMRQVAVVEGGQRKGVGTALVRYAEELVRKLGFVRLTAHAREVVVPFYRRLGYHTVGDRFIEVTIPHWMVEKDL